MIRLFIEGLRISNPNNGAHGHWSKVHKERTRVKRAVWAEGMVARIKPDQPFKKSKVTVTRYGPRTLDVDNLYSACKAVFDSLKVGCLDIIQDDNPDVCELIAKQAKGEYAVEIVVEELG